MHDELSERRAAETFERDKEEILAAKEAFDKLSGAISRGRVSTKEFIQALPPSRDQLVKKRAKARKAKRKNGGPK